MTQVNGMKNVIMQVTYFLNGPMVNLFYCHILQERDFLRESLPRYPWSPNCMDNFRVSLLLMKVSKYWKIVEFPKISIKTKKFKTFYYAKTASRLKEIIQHPPTKQKLCLWNKNFLTEIYTNKDIVDICFPSALRIQILSV